MDTSSEEWRLACEIRWIMRQPKEARREYYRLVAKERGDATAKALIEAVNRAGRKAASSASLFPERP